MTQSRKAQRREAGIATLKAAVTTASIAAMVGGWAVISMAESSTVAATQPAEPTQIAANDVTLVGTPTPIAPATATQASSDPAATPTAPQATVTPAPTQTPLPTQAFFQPNPRQFPGLGGNTFSPRTRTSR